MSTDTCPCGSGLGYAECCGPVIAGERQAETPEQLMRSRYTAYALKEVGHLYASLHPDHRADFNEKSTRQWAESSEWHKLEIVSTHGGGPDDSEGAVEFVATYSMDGARRDHHELAMFKKDEGSWYFVDGQPVRPKQFVREAPKTGRNEPCPCGSGKKFKKCCGK